jgi:hypothetical protein
VTRRPRWPAVLVDAIFLAASLFLVYTLLGGEVRWKTPLFRITLTEPDRPVQVCVLALVLKAVLGLDGGLLAALAATRLPVVRPLAAGLHALDRRLRGLYLTYRAPLALAAAVLLASLGVLEAYFRLLPHTLPPALANHVAAAYHTGPSGIYRYAADLGIDLMRPHHERTMYFNGYRWRHRTDAWGFRNPVDRATATVVLAGDSMVYGHGVDETSTVRHHLEALLGEPVANLGLQGSSIHQEYQVLKRQAPRLRPRYVFVFFLSNDIDDLGMLTDAERAAFLRTPADDHVTPYVVPKRPQAAGLGLERLLADLSVVKALGFLRGHVRARWPRPAHGFPLEDDSRVRFHLHALRKIQDLARRQGFAFVHVFAYTARLADEASYEALLESFCRAQGIAFLSLRPAFEAARRDGRELYLAGDGHYADAGARLAAEVLAEYVGRHPAP